MGGWVDLTDRPTAAPAYRDLHKWKSPLPTETDSGGSGLHPGRDGETGGTLGKDGVRRTTGQESLGLGGGETGRKL